MSAVQRVKTEVLVVGAILAALFTLAGVGSAGAREAGYRQLAASAPQSGANGERIVSSTVARYGGVTTWFEQSSGRNRAQLFAEVDGGQPAALPVPLFRDVGDVDLGPDGKGGVVAAYSRCQGQETAPGGRKVLSLYPVWALRRGCDLYRFDFSTMKEARIPGASTRQASEFLPTIWKDKIAFARVYEKRSGERGLLPYVYVRNLDGTGGSRRQPGGSRGTMGLPGPSRMDLYGKRLSFVWNFQTNTIGKVPSSGKTELRLDTVGHSHRVISRSAWGTRDQQGFASFVGPQSDRGRIRFGFQRTYIREGPDTSKTSLLESYGIGDRERSLASAPDFLTDVAADRGRTAIAAGRTDTVPSRILLGANRP